MIKIFYFTILALVSSLSSAAPSASHFDRLSHACYTVFSQNESALMGCLVNIHNDVKRSVQSNLSTISQRDAVHVLNTKALKLNINSHNCNNASLNPITIKSCQLNADISVLRYLELRYG